MLLPVDRRHQMVIESAAGVGQVSGEAEDLMGSEIDVLKNRAARKWSRRELIARAMWDVVSVPLFAWTPRQLWTWRNLLLRIFGAKIGRKVHVYPSVRIDLPWNLEIGDYSAIGNRAILYALGPITIGQRVTISQYAHLCAGSHDYTDPAMPLLKLPIAVEDDAWICADAFIGPGVKISSRAIVAARAVVVKDVVQGTIVGGNPARPLKQREPEA